MFDVAVAPKMIYASSESSSSSNPTTTEPAVKEYKTEFHRAYNELTSDLQSFRDNYPLTTLISIVAFTIFGFFNVISIFSPTTMIAGAMLLGLSTTFAFSIYKDPGAFWESLKASLWQVKEVVFKGEEVKKNEEGSKPKAN